MTLLLNEIVLRRGMTETFQIIAADRRITRKGNYAATRPKLFLIPYLNATISYFGIASYFKNGKEIYLADILPYFINQCASTIKDVSDFALQLREYLHKDIPRDDLRTRFSGFHFSTYINDRPDFWYMSNIQDLDGFSYKNPSPEYHSPSSHFLERDASLHFGWNGNNDDLVKPGSFLYRNGDIRVHALTSDEIDKMMRSIFQFPDFHRPKTPDEYAEYILFKFEVLSYIYKKWASKKFIAKPIDVLILRKDGMHWHKH